MKFRAIKNTELYCTYGGTDLPISGRDDFRQIALSSWQKGGKRAAVVLRLQSDNFNFDFSNLDSFCCLDKGLPLTTFPFTFPHVLLLTFSSFSILMTILILICQSVFVDNITILLSN